MRVHRSLAHWARIAVVALLSLVLLGGGIMFFAPAEPANAQNNGSWTREASMTVNGDFVMAGNGVLRCNQGLGLKCRYLMRTSVFVRSSA